MTDPAVTRFPGVHLRPDSNRYQFGLKPPDELAHHFPGEWAVRRSLRTSDLSKANAMAKVLHAEWTHKFEALARSDNPVAVDLTPGLATAIAAEIRRWVLVADDNMRDFPDVPDELLAIAERKRRRDSGSAIQSLRIDVSTPTAKRESAGQPFAGLNKAQLGAVAAFHAMAEGHAAVNMAARNLKSVQAIAELVANEMGLSIDWTTEAGRAGLLECLKAYRTATADVVQRDAGCVIDTPAQPVNPGGENSNFLSPSAQQRNTKNPKRIRDALENWEREKHQTDKTTGTFRRHARMFADMMGDPVLSDLTPPDGLTFRDCVQTWAMKPVKTATTANNVLVSVRAMMTLAVQRGWMPLNILTGVTVRRGGVESEGYLPWSSDDLIRLFDSPVFTRYELPTTVNAGADAAYWVPLLLAFTGARPAEPAQLYTDDVFETPEGLAIEFRENPARQQRLKKKPGALLSPSARVTPVHPELIRLGFRDYWQSMVAHGVGPLFPALPRNWQNGLAAALGKWFGPFKSAQGFRGQPKTLHSFRHTVRQELGFAGVDSALSSAIIGHTNPDTHDATYGRDMRRHPDRLRPHLEKLRYPGLVLPRVFSEAAWAPPEVSTRTVLSAAVKGR